MNLFSETFSTFLVIVLLHSLWQAAILYFVYEAICYFLPSSSRYFFGIATLLVFLMSVGFTFWHLFSPAVNIDISYYDSFVVNESRSFLSRYSQFLTYCWMFGISFFSLRLGLGFVYVERLKNAAELVINQEVLDVVEKIKRQLGYSRKVLLLESSNISSPATVGWLKPVILFPLGMLSGLSQHHVEAIFAHEIAHLKRHDYLVNILQSLVDILFFFNPFVWLISRKIRIERENCCDDLALTVCEQKGILASALLEVASLSSQYNLTMNFHGKQNLLTYRIKRIMGVKEQKAQFGLWIPLVVFLTLGMVFFAKDTESKGVANNNLVVGLDTSINEEGRQLSLEIRKLREQVTANSINLEGIEIVGNKKNTHVVADIHDQVTAQRTKKLSEEERASYNTRFSENDKAWSEIEIKEARLKEIVAIQKQTFLQGVRNLLKEAEAEGLFENRPEFSIHITKERFLKDNEPQSDESYQKMLHLFDKHLGKEEYFEVNSYVKNKEIGFEKGKYGLNLVFTSFSKDGKKGTAYFNIENKYGKGN